MLYYLHTMKARNNMSSLKELYAGLTGRYDLSKVLGIDESKLEDTNNESVKEARRLLLTIMRHQKPLVVDGKKIFQLQQAQDIEAMAGYEYAGYVWETQIAPKLTSEDLEKGFTIYLPTHVFLITSSFIDRLIGCVLACKDGEKHINKFSLCSEDDHVQAEIDELLSEYQRPSENN